MRAENSPMAGIIFRSRPRPSLATLCMSKEALARSIADAALLRGQFTLRSGKTSSYYLDKYLFSTRPEVLGQLAPMFAGHRCPGGPP